VSGAQFRGAFVTMKYIFLVHSFTPIVEIENIKIASNLSIYQLIERISFNYS